MNRRIERYNVGDRIQNRYQIYKTFEGGFGVVYICYDHEFREPVAIKGFKGDLALNEKVIQRFRREAFEWVELERHQNIVIAKYVEIIEGRPYIFLEYIAGAEGVGSNLADWMRYGRVDYKHALKFAVHITNGMDYGVFCISPRKGIFQKLSS